MSKYFTVNDFNIEYTLDGKTIRIRRDWCEEDCSPRAHYDYGVEIDGVDDEGPVYTSLRDAKEMALFRATGRE